jgi:hypothetical protein
MDWQKRSPHDVVQMLNEATKADREAMTRLVESRVGCAPPLADHPTVQVTDDGNGDSVGMLGILNGIFGVDSTGSGAIAAEFDESGELKGFLVRERSSQESHMRPTIYIASRTRHAAKWRNLRRAGYPIISSWIDTAGIESEDWCDAWHRCFEEVARADGLVVYAQEDDQILRGALIEVGVALAEGVPVISVGAEKWLPGLVESRRVKSAGSVADAMRQL